MAKVYTKKGDSGETKMLGGAKIDKASCNSEAIGDLDELNSHIGLCISFMYDYGESDLNFIDERDYLSNIQTYLFKVGTIVASPKNKDSDEIVFDKDQEITKEMERRIDNLTYNMPTLKNFIAPTGTKVASQLHITRSVCRRAERHMKALINQNDNIYIKNNCGAFMNRLSDYLFTLARYSNHICSIPEIIMKNI